MLIKQLNTNKKAWLWLLQFIVVISVLALNLVNSPLKLNANLADLFNSPQQTELDLVTNKIEQQNLNKQIVLIGASSLETAIKKADDLAVDLKNLVLVDTVKTNFSDLPNFKDIISEHLPYKHYLLGEKFEQLLNQGNAQKTFAYQFSLLNQVADQSVSLTIEQDPTLSLADFLSRPLMSTSGLSLKQEHLVAQYNDKYYILLTFSTKSDSIDIEAAQQLTVAIEQLTKSDEVEYLYTGAIFYTSKASKVGQYEMMLYGGISIIATLLLIILVYRSFTALIATAFLIATSFTYGYLALSLFYDQINIITLVFSITLIGIAADYSFHALTELKFGNININKSQPLSSIHSSLTMSYITTGAGYALLLLAPFVLFQQIALFTLFGLLGALLTVILLYPLLLPSIHPNYRQKHNVLDDGNFISVPKIVLNLNRLQQLIIKSLAAHKKITVLTFLLCLSLGGFVQFNDDVRNYYTPDQQLKSNELKVKSILKTKWDLQYFLVQGKTEQQVLENEEILLTKLRPLVLEGNLNNISGITQWLPSIKKQKENKQLLNLARNTDQFNSIISLLSSSNWTLNDDQPFLLPKNWLDSHLGKMHKQQWVVDKPHYYSVVRLAGIDNLEQLSDLALSLKQVNFIDKAQSISTQLEQFRKHLLLVLGAAIIAAFIVFNWRYGMSVAAIGLLTPVFALSVSLIISYFIQQYLNIFNLVAGILILALGLDYSVFYAEHGFKEKITLTTLMSALSSIFVFAILMLSSMPAIRSFGLTVFIGILLTFILAPLVTRAKSKHSSINLVSKKGDFYE